MDKYTELSDILIRYREASETHDKRFLMLMNKQLGNYKKWAELCKSKPVNSVEFALAVEELWKESKSLGEQFEEVVRDMADDTGILVEFFNKGKEVYE